MGKLPRSVLSLVVLFGVFIPDGDGFGLLGSDLYLNGCIV